MKFQLSTMLLVLALTCVSLSWYASEMRSRSEPDYFAKFDSLAYEEYKYEDMLRFRGEFVDVNRHADIADLDLRVTADLLSVEQDTCTYLHGPYATLRPIPGQPNRMKIECDYPCEIAGRSGSFLIQLSCMVNGEVVAIANKTINVEPPAESLYLSD